MALTPIDIDKLIIKQHNVDGRKIYGAKHDSNYIVGTGCVLYDPTNYLMILANEKNKLDHIKKINAGSFLNVDKLTYYEDFGGKVEDKHVSMNVVDVAVSELYEESSLLFNFNYEDFRGCHYVLVDVPNQPNLQYITFFLPFSIDVGKFKNYARQFYENYDFNKDNLLYKCQKQFLEISDINIFSIKDIDNDKERIRGNKLRIKGFYGSDDDLYSVPSLCGNLYMSSRMFNTLDKLANYRIDLDKKQQVIQAYSYYAHGMNQYLSKNNIDEANKQEDEQKKVNLQQYLHKFFIAHAKISPETWIGGDTPIMYYYDIVQSLDNKKQPDDCKYKISYPKVTLYTSSNCASLAYNTYMAAYGTTDTTNICLSKFITPKDNHMFKDGVFFHINNRLYFSYATYEKNSGTDENLNINTKENVVHYTRIYIGSVRIKDENIVADDTLLYGQTLAFDSHSDIAMHCHKQLISLKEHDGIKEPVLTYFDCDEINQGRYGNQTALKAFDTLVEGTKRGTIVPDNTIAIKQYLDYNQAGYVRPFVEYDPNEVNYLNIKGNYKLFHKFYKEECTNTADTNIQTANGIYSIINSFNPPREMKLSRTSGPFELECANGTVQVNDESIFNINNKIITYNGLTFVSESLDMLPKFYLSSGLYDCYKYTDKISMYVPLYRLKANKDPRDMTFNMYKIAWECIYPSGRQFQITDVKYELIRVVKSAKVDDLVEWYKDNKNKRNINVVDYWRRVIYLKPIELENRAAPAAGGTIKKTKHKRPTKTFY